MANSKELLHDLMKKIQLDDSADELKSMLLLVFERLFGLRRTDVLAGREIAIVDQIQLDNIIARINRHEPVQYILGEADFYGRRFLVDSSVLIPRPETELIIDEVLRTNTESGSILDIGTGSGCIAVTLALECSSMKVTGIDISNNALKVARANAALYQQGVQFRQHDIFSAMLPLPSADIIVSNPPYIPPTEKKGMQPNVLAYEPAMALFVPEDDPLIYYKAIAGVAIKILNPEGRLIVEINERFGEEVMNLFLNNGFKNVVVRKDFNNKDRIVVASL